MRVYRRCGKRVLDLLLASLALLLLAPVMAAIALILKLHFRGPVLFRQPRLGKAGRVFTLIKFATMSDAVDAEGNLLPDSERLTDVGRFLRSTSLDELPELVNVLRHEMSLVGPRPLLVRYRDRYSPEQWRRHEVLPGITGWAQVNGRNVLSWEEKFRLDVWYVDHLSLALDLKILAMTVTRTLAREGISQPGHDTVEEFRGSP